MKNMKTKFFFIFLLCVLSACNKKDSVKMVSDYKFYKNRNGMNGDVISFNEFGIYLFDGNQLTTYDFNGSRIGNTLVNTSYFNYYRSVAIYDTMLVLAASDFGIFKINTTYPFANLIRNMKYNYYCEVNDIYYKDSFLYMLNGRQSNMDQIPFYKSIAFPNHSLPRRLFRFKLNFKNNSISELENDELAATSITVMNDSLMFFADRFVSRFNVKQSTLDIKMFPFSINPNKNITSITSKSNRLYVANEKSIYFFEYANDELLMKGEIE